jgi:phage protein D
MAYSFSKLQEKYKNFQSPTYKVCVEGATLPKTINLGELQTELTISRLETGFAHIEAHYSEDTTSAHDPSALLSAFPLMGKIKIDMGYNDSLQTGFEGYIFERELKIKTFMMCRLSISCLDGKALLRINNEFLSHAPVKSYAELVKKIASKYGMNLKVDSTPGFAKPSSFNQNGATDFDFISEIAEKTGYEFFALAQDLFFRKPGTEKLITLGQDCLHEIDYKTSLAGIYPKIELLSYNSDKKSEGKTTAASPDYKIGKGRTGSEILSKKAKNLALHKRLFINNITERDLSAILQSQMRENSMGLAKLLLHTNGLPELIPGRILTLSGIGKGIDNDYYVQSVRHDFNRHGYRTELDCRSNTVL